MCIDFDGHHFDGSSFVYVYDIWILLYIKKKTCKGSQPSIWSRTPNSVRIRQSGRIGNRGMTCSASNGGGSTFSKGIQIE